MLTADDLLGAADGAARCRSAPGRVRAVRHRRPDGAAGPALPGQSSPGPDPRAGGAIAAVRAGPVTAEAGLFNGDEPERPGQWPRLGGRFGDSWSGRLTAGRSAGLRAAGLARPRPLARAPARARDRPGQVEPVRALGGPCGAHPVYGLVEWARTSEADGFFVFHSAAGRRCMDRGPPSSPLPVRAHRAAGGGADRAGSARSGPTWRTRSSASPGGPSTRSATTSRPCRRSGRSSCGRWLESRLRRIAKVGGGLFDVDGLYGRTDFWSLDARRPDRGWRADASDGALRRGWRTAGGHDRMHD